MIRFETKTLGNVVIRFKHNLPSIVVPDCKNDLRGMVNNLKIKQGSTECEVETRGDFYFGTAYTHPCDQYKKEVGRELALKRAIERDFTDQESREIMAGYYSR